MKKKLNSIWFYWSNIWYKSYISTDRKCAFYISETLALFKKLLILHICWISFTHTETHNDYEAFFIDPKILQLLFEEAHIQMNLKIQLHSKQWNHIIVIYLVRFSANQNFPSFWPIKIYLLQFSSFVLKDHFQCCKKQMNQWPFKICMNWRIFDHNWQKQEEALLIQSMKK